eukprot:7364601-Ditylum_brightwellii.AAC.1
METKIIFHMETGYAKSQFKFTGKSLDEKSHPADWVNALLLLIPKDNLEDLSEVDVTGNRVTKFVLQIGLLHPGPTSWPPHPGPQY